MPKDDYGLYPAQNNVYIIKEKISCEKANVSIALSSLSISYLSLQCLEPVFCFLLAYIIECLDSFYFFSCDANFAAACQQFCAWT